MSDNAVWVAVVTYGYEGDCHISGCRVFRTEQAAKDFAAATQARDGASYSVEIFDARVEGDAPEPRSDNYAMSVYGANPFRL